MYTWTNGICKLWTVICVPFFKLCLFHLCSVLNYRIWQFKVHKWHIYNKIWRRNVGYILVGNRVFNRSLHCGFKLNVSCDYNNVLVIIHRLRYKGNTSVESVKTAHDGEIYSAILTVKVLYDQCVCISSNAVWRNENVGTDVMTFEWKWSHDNKAHGLRVCIS